MEQGPAGCCELLEKVLAPLKQQRTPGRYRSRGASKQPHASRRRLIPRPRPAPAAPPHPASLLADHSHQPPPIGPWIQWFPQDLSPAFCCRPQCTAHSVGCPGDARHACRPTHPEGGARVEWLAPGPPSSLDGCEGGRLRLGPTEVSPGCVLESQVLEDREPPPQVPPISTPTRGPHDLRPLTGGLEPRKALPSKGEPPTQLHSESWGLG